MSVSCGSMSVAISIPPPSAAVSATACRTSSRTSNGSFCGSGIRVKRRKLSTKAMSRRLVAEIVSSPCSTSRSSGLPRWSSVSLSEVTGASEFMISCVRIRVSLLHDSICISFSSLLMSPTVTTRSRCFSSTISEQPSVSAISPLSVTHVTRSFSPGRIAASARQASGAEVSSCRIWVMRCMPKMRSASPLA